MSHEYGADLTRIQYIRLVIAICLGALIEWYDFTIYSQLSATMTPLFFPKADETAQQLSYWAVYAAGFVARPVGAILFGHLGDARGRRQSLLLSILTMAVPSILIGALPTHAQAGDVAPVLLALLRVVQGLALGGEFGTSLVYMFELVPSQQIGFMVALANAAAGPGIILALLMVSAVTYGCTSAQLLVWGWRVPFLLTAVSAPIAVMLRMHMPEPRVFLASQLKERMLCAQGLVDCAATKRNSLELPVLDEQPSSQCEASSPRSTDAVGVTGSSSDSADIMIAVHQENNDSSSKEELPPAPRATKSSSKEELPPAPRATKHYIPLRVLLRDHWRQFVLFIMLQAVYGVWGYQINTWILVYVRSPAVGVSAVKTYHVLIVATFTQMCGKLVSGHFVGDKRVPKLYTLLIAFACTVALGPAALLWVGGGSVVARWVAVLIGNFFNGFMAVLSSLHGLSIFPPSVRASGFNMTHNISMAVYGGCVPLIVTALGTQLHPLPLAAGVVLVLFSGLSFASVPFLARLAPYMTTWASIGDAVASANLR